MSVLPESNPVPKSLLLFLAGLLLFQPSLVAQNQAAGKTDYRVAVVDAILADGMDPAAVGPITERAGEALLTLCGFTVLDRSYIGAILKEMEFQYSSLVDPAKAAAAGTMLGAEYLLAIKVDRVDNIFFLNVKLLESSTGKIVAQSSESRETPKISALVDMVALATARLVPGGSPAARSPDAVPPVPRKVPRIGFVTAVDPGSSDYERSAWAGLSHFAEAQGLRIGQDLVMVQAPYGEPFEKALEAFAGTGPDLIICTGFMYAPMVERVALRYPYVRFALIDATAKAPNVRSVFFSEKDGSFLVGLAAGLQALNDGREIVGFIGGMDIPVIRQFYSGFVQGVKAVYPACLVLVDWAGDFQSPGKGATLAGSQFDRGVHVIYAAAGVTGNGVFQEAVDRRKRGDLRWVIGVDIDQYGQGIYSPGKSVTLTSLVKRTDAASHLLARSIDIPIEDWGTPLVLGVYEGGLGLPMVNPNLDPGIAAIIADYERRIYEGQFHVRAEP